MTMPEIENVEQTVAHGPPKVTYRMLPEGILPVLDASLFGAAITAALIGPEFEACCHKRERAKALFKYLDGIPPSNKLNCLIRQKFRYLFTSPKTFIISHARLLGATMGGISTATYIGVHNYLAEKRGVRDAYNQFAALSASATTNWVLALEGSFTFRLKTVVPRALLGGAVFAVPANWLMEWEPRGRAQFRDWFASMTGPNEPSPIPPSIEEQGMGSD